MNEAIISSNTHRVSICFRCDDQECYKNNKVSCDVKVIADLEKVLEKLTGIENRKARFKTVISLIIDGKETGLYPVALWISPTRLDIHFDEEVRKACMWYGCTANYEIDRRTDFYRWFCSKESQLFLEWTPKIARNPLKPNKDPEYGTRSGDPFQLAQQLQVTKMYIDGTNIEDYNGHVHRIKYISLLKQLLDYDHLNRTKSDLVISLMMSLLPIFGESQVGKSETQRPKAILPKYAIKIPA